MADTLYYIHTNNIYYIENNIHKNNLFGSCFYYLQNEISDNTVRFNSKALLFLHTLPFNYYNNINLTNTNFSSFFNKKNGRGGTETVPYGYLLLLGGLIWRKKYMDSHNGTDPINYKRKVDGKSFKSPDQDYTLFYKDVYEEKYCLAYSYNKNIYNVKYTDIVGTNGNSIIEKKLVDCFESFVNNEFRSIYGCCELKKKLPNDTQIKYLGYKDIIDLIDCLKNDKCEQPINIKQSLNNTQVNSSPLNIKQDKFTKNMPMNHNTTSNKDISKINKCTEYLNGTKQITRKNGNVFSIVNFGNNYELGYIQYDLINIFYSESNPIQNIFNDLFFKKVVVTTIPTRANKNGIPKSVLQSYYTGYTNMLQGFKQTIEDQEKIAQNFSDDTPDQRDFKCEIYLTIKNIWDRWLCGYYNSSKQDTGGLKNNFSVEKFFNGNFVFIDSFYNNIYDKLKLNCELLYDWFKNTENNQTNLGCSTISYLGSVAGAHMCMLFNFPDNVNFAEVDENGSYKAVDMMQNMRDVFTPLASNKMNGPDYMNKFTVIYTHSANKLDTVDRNKFVHDSFDIWSFDNGTGVAPSVFNTSSGTYNQNDTDNMTNNARIGYKVPAFGVAYSRQNNSLWKNIQISMDNFNVTEQSIRAEAQIANKGNSEGRNITFYGQDIYSLYQAYSYLVTVEMMGDAQIQPLMYFQLMNVPMFRGTYMIIRVEHNITPGNMTTTFTGMKMSKVQAPYTTSWFTTSSDASYISVPPKDNMDASNNGEALTATDGTSIDIEDNKLSKAINNHLSDTVYCDDFVIAVYKDLGVKITKKLQ